MNEVNEVTYPNAEHEKAEHAARRRALHNLLTVTEEAAKLTKAVTDGEPDGDDARTLTEAVRGLTEQLARLEALREVREWDAATKPDPVTVTDGLTGLHWHDGGLHPGWKGHTGFAVHRHDMGTGVPVWELIRGDGTPITTDTEKLAWDEAGRP